MYSTILLFSYILTHLTIIQFKYQLFNHVIGVFIDLLTIHRFPPHFLGRRLPVVAKRRRMRIVWGEDVNTEVKSWPRGWP